MTTVRRKVVCSLALLTTTLALTGAVWVDDFVLIRNQKNPLSSIEKGNLKKVLTGQTKQWPNGFVVQVVIGEPGSPELSWIAARIFGISEKELVAKIKQQVFRGDMKRPIFVTSAAECVDAVMRNDGAVAAIAASAIPTLPPEVSILTVTE